MTRWFGALFFCCLFNLPTLAQEKVAQHWASWRGPLGTGVAPDANPPIEWSETKNIRWKVPLPGKGHSTPIVWGDRIFLTAAVPVGQALEPKYSGRPGAHNNLPVTSKQKFIVMAVNRGDGKINWQNAVHQQVPIEGSHESASLASNSPVTDGQRVYAFFGSHGLYCLDVNGKLLWKATLGQMHTKHGHGEGASPVLFGETLVVNWDHEGDSFVVAYDKVTGKVRWKVKRDEATSWATPIVVKHKGVAQLIVPGTNRMRAYDLVTGKVIWECGGLSANIVASPVYANGMVFAGSSYNIRAMLGIHLDGAKGDITQTDRVAWKRVRGCPYVPSPLLYGDVMYVIRHYQSILSRVELKTGDDRGGPFRLNGIRNIYASPVGAAGRVYITDLDGRTLVMSHAETLKMLALNELDEGIAASAAIVGHDMFLRGERHLYRIAEK